MSVLNDDGFPLDLSTVFILFLMPNFTFIILSMLHVYLLHVSKKHPRLNHLLGELANFFAKGALDRIVRNMMRHFEIKNRQHQKQVPLNEQGPFNMQKSPHTSKYSSPTHSSFDLKKKYDVNYLLLVPFQFDLLLTVLVYKILTRDVFPETCQSYLTTYHNRPTQVVCWLKHINKNVSNWSPNITLHQYCTNQSITYINYEHNDVICTQYVFKLINIIDTVTNIFAWHQATVFIVTKSIVFSYWYQHKLRRTICWSNIFNRQRRIILFIVICFITSIYILVFIFLLPIRFFLIERRRVDLTRHLLYACAKFIISIIVHVNLYTLYQWHSLNIEKRSVLTGNEEKAVDCDQTADSVVSIPNRVYDSPPSMDNNLDGRSNKYLTIDSSV